jgi:hypothetical protein
MRLDPRIRALVAKADQLIAESGCRAVCIACFNYQLTDIDPCYQGGCCTGCVASVPTGCEPKPVSCAVWLCTYAKRRFPELDVQLGQLRYKAGELGSNTLYHRLASLTEESRLVQIQEAKP